MTTGPLTAWRATGLYLLATLAMSWPLALQIDRAPAGDLGDPLLNAWILAWGSEHFTALLGGDLGAFSQWWNANIFHPSPLALAYSEHLAPQVLMGLPIWWLTRNVLLVYNVLYLASMVLSGLGMFLLVRELTGRPRAALVAGLFFAFVPYRIAQTAHLQVLWSQWMPFVLYALRCYFERGRRRALVGALSALVAQQLSCGYYLVYFSPFVALYVIWEITARRRWHDWRLLATMAAGAILDLAIVWPFVSPYLQLRELGFQPRPLREVARFSADTTAYFAVHEGNRVWGSVLRSLPRPENELFGGLIPLVMAALGLAAIARARWTATEDLSTRHGWRRWVGPGCAVLAVIGSVAIVTYVLTGGTTLRLAGLPLVRVRTIDRGLILFGLGLSGLFVVSPRARAWCVRGTDLRGCAVVLLGLAVVLSWGPEPLGNGQPLQFTGPYLWLYEYVPGVDGLRVPARLAMVAYVFLAVLGGYGLALIDRLRHGLRWMAILGALFLAEATGVPITIAANWTDPGVAMPPAQVYPVAEAPDVYKKLATMPPGTVVVELPFGFPSWELRYVFYSSVHLHRLVNGYSGGFPEDYLARSAALMYPLEQPERAWQALLSSGATHVVVHRAAYPERRDEPVVDWLRGHGGRIVGTFGADQVVMLPR
jgi:hypothetical protein